MNGPKKELPKIKLGRKSPLNSFSYSSIIGRAFARFVNFVVRIVPRKRKFEFMKGQQAFHVDEDMIKNILHKAKDEEVDFEEDPEVLLKENKPFKDSPKDTFTEDALNEIFIDSDLSKLNVAQKAHLINDILLSPAMEGLELPLNQAQLLLKHSKESLHLIENYPVALRVLIETQPNYLENLLRMASVESKPKKSESKPLMGPHNETFNLFKLLDSRPDLLKQLFTHFSKETVGASHFWIAIKEFAQNKTYVKDVEKALAQSPKASPPLSPKSFQVAKTEAKTEPASTDNPLSYLSAHNINLSADFIAKHQAKNHFYPVIAVHLAIGQSLDDKSLEKLFKILEEKDLPYHDFKIMDYTTYLGLMHDVIARMIKDFPGAYKTLELKKLPDEAEEVPQFLIDVLAIQKKKELCIDLNNLNFFVVNPNPTKKHLKKAVCTTYLNSVAAQLGFSHKDLPESLMDLGLLLSKLDADALIDAYVENVNIKTKQKIFSSGNYKEEVKKQLLNLGIIKKTPMQHIPR